MSEYTLTNIKSALIMAELPFMSDGRTVILDNDNEDKIMLSEDNNIYINDKQVSDEEFEDFVIALKRGGNING